MINWNRMSDDELKEIMKELKKEVEESNADWRGNPPCVNETYLQWAKDIQKIQTKRKRARAIIPDLIKEMYEDEI